MTDFRRSGATTFSDVLGIAASTACALHCLLLPTVLLAGGSLPFAFLGDESLHKVLLFIVFPAAVVGFGFGFAQHKDRVVAIAGLLGLAGMLFAVTVGHDVVGEIGERIVTVTCAATLIGAHIRNYRLCRAVSRTRGVSA